MSEIIFQEAEIFTASFLCGVFLLFCYDIIRIVRRTISHGRKMISIEDFLFCVISGIFVFCVMYEKNNGTVRGSALLTIAFGMMCYYTFVSRYVVRFGYAFIGKTIKKIYSFAFKGLKKLQKTVKLLVGQKEGKKEQEEQHEKSTKRSS